MRHKRWLGPAALIGVLLLAMSSDSFAQRGGRGAAAGRGGRGARRLRRRALRRWRRRGQPGGTAIGPGGGERVGGGSGRGSYTTGRGTTIDYGGAGVKGTGPGGVHGRPRRRRSPGHDARRTDAHQGRHGRRRGRPWRPGRGRRLLGRRDQRAARHGRDRLARRRGDRARRGRRRRFGASASAGGTRRRGRQPLRAVALHARSAAAAVVGHRTTYVGTTALRTQGVYRAPRLRPLRLLHADLVSAPRRRLAAGRPGRPPCTGRAPPGRRSRSPAATPRSRSSTTTAHVVYEDNRVYYNGEPVASAEEYTDQAAAIAVKGQDAKVSDKDEWVSLGVFGMVQGDEKDANNIFQLAINKDGVIRGNYYNALTDTTCRVSGSVDKRTQRAAWTVGDRKETVYETGIGNLSEAETTMLVHFGKDRTQQWTLVRLEPPDKE